MASCLLMFCHISNGMLAFVSKVMLTLGLCRELVRSEAFLFCFGLG